jgi:hypothetical protein
MVRHTALLAALALTFTLGACSSKDDNEDAAGAQAQAEAAAPPDEPAVAEAPVRTLDFWKVIGPLAAGKYSGTCGDMSSMRAFQSAITVGADGKASGGDLQADFHLASMAGLNRSRDQNGQYSAMLTLSIDEKKSGGLSLTSDATGRAGSASLTRGDKMLNCANTAMGPALGATSPYAAVSKLLDTSKLSMDCNDPKDIMVQRKVDVRLADGAITIGDTTFDLKTASGESVMFSDAGRSLLLGFTLADERSVNVGYGGDGKMSLVHIWHKSALTHSCTAQR